MADPDPGLIREREEQLVPTRVVDGGRAAAGEVGACGADVGLEDGVAYEDVFWVKASI